MIFILLTTLSIGRVQDISSTNKILLYFIYIYLKPLALKKTCNNLSHKGSELNLEEKTQF